MKNETKIINRIVKMLEDGASIDICIHDLTLAAKLIESLPCYETDKIIDAVFGEAEVTENA